jgi:hypothetical protein
MATPSSSNPARYRGVLTVALWVVACLLAVGAPPSHSFSLAATDAGFVTEKGGSAKGDGTVASGATFNYSVGFELHYSTGALGAPLAPMLRKNYFVFDLTDVTAPLTSATLKLWTGKLESADPAELFVLHGPADMGLAVSLAADLAAGTTTAEFDEPDDPLVLEAGDLFGLLTAGPPLAPPFAVTSADDGSFIDIALSPDGVAYLSGFIGTKVLLSGFVPSIDGMPPDVPQQPFGFTGPDIPGGDPLTPMLILGVVPEPPAVALAFAGVSCFLLLVTLRRNRAGVA